jgi:hypothetical protein
MRKTTVGPKTVDQLYQHREADKHAEQAGRQAGVAQTTIPTAKSIGRGSVRSHRDRW